MTESFGQSTALNVGGGDLTAAARDRLKKALEGLASMGLWDVASGTPRESPALAPIDAMAANWPEISNPRVLGGVLPFRFWQCEALIGEAIDHLNHCVRERQHYDDLRARFCALWLEIQAFLLHDNVTEAERQSEQRKRQRENLQTSHDQISHHIDETHAAAGQLRDHIQSDPWNIDLQAGIHADIARLSFWSPYWNSHDAGAKNGWTTIDTNKNPVNPVAGLPALHDWVFEQTRRIRKLELEGSLFARQHDLKMLEEAESSSRRDLEVVERDQATFEAAIGFEDQRIDARRMAAYLQIIAITQPGGAHNYAEQMKAVRLRFLSHMADAVARLLRTAEGMTIVYGFPLALPDAKAAEEKGYSYLDVLIAWVQQAASFLTRFNKRDQVTDIVVSVRQTLGATGWDDVLDDTDPRYRFRVEIPMAVFEAMYYPRFRGAALFVVTKDNKPLRGTFAAQISLPKSGLLRYFEASTLYLEAQPFERDGIVIPASSVTPWHPAGDGIVALTGDHPIKQDNAPPARSGRVGQRESIAGYDVVGTMTLANLSPIGRATNRDDRCWTIDIDKLSSQGESFTDVVEDLELEIHVAYQESLA